ncbi:helix-turn-helix domain-containing protein [Kibdelosporangium persicum]|uniref:helix-turn-helix domain-containing protein n=1 Tax=Kibdelosporangium persicum TaxID=2698649 RepID=UPI001FEB0550|nr:helix-turn-helix domain-containing protein [Kibdelosporangium persicum]
MSSQDEKAANGAGHTPLLVLGKITEILNAFTLQRPDLTLREIQQSTGLPASTVQRLVTNLVVNGFLDRRAPTGPQWTCRRSPRSGPSTSAARRREPADYFVCR